jgi:glucan biosynthesis protein C
VSGRRGRHAAAGTGAAALDTSRALPASAAAPPSDRLLFVDNIRWSIIVLVLSMHACVTYSPFGGWYYRDRTPMSFGTALIFSAYQSFLQGFFMSLLFFIAGYFAAVSCQRKGPGRFLRDRAFRLGVPTVLYMLTIGPATEFLAGNWSHHGFTATYMWMIETGRILGQTGPMWFCAALLIFSAVYAGLC